MSQSNKNNPSSDPTIFESGSYLFASNVCDTLEKAGIPAILRQAGRYQVAVPEEFSRQSQQLLSVEPHSAEIFCYCR